MRNDRPSSTALVIARTLVMAAGNRRFRDLLVPGEAEAYLQVIRTYRPWWASLLVFLRRFDLVHRLFAWLEGLVIPGLTLHFLVRKRAIEAIVKDAIEKDGVTQVLVLAAGFDTLCWRLRELYPAVTFIETDHPATQAVKRAACQERPNHRLIPVDYRVTTLTKALSQSSHFDPKATTAVVAEGLLMYLAASVVDGLFAELRALIDAPIQFAFTSMDVAPPPRGFAFAGPGRFAAWWLKLRGEPFIFGIPKVAVASWLNERHWRLRRIEDRNVTTFASVVVPIMGNFRNGHGVKEENTEGLKT